MVMETSQCREEELTRDDYLKLVLAPHTGRGIMANTVRESQRISLLKLSRNFDPLMKPDACQTPGESDLLYRSKFPAKKWT